MVRQTSIDAYNKIKSDGLLSKKRWQIYSILFNYGPMTANELFRKLQGTTSITQSNIHARLGEMRLSTCVEEVGKAVCSVTKNSVISWDVTNRLPIKLKKFKREKCPHCNGSGYADQGELF